MHPFANNGKRTNKLQTCVVIMKKAYSITKKFNESGEI